MHNKKIIINVGRQLGSGGHDIARMLALDFDAKYYDKEILNLAAKESGFSEKFFEQNDEKRGFFKSLFHMHAPHLDDNNLYNNNFSQEGLFKFQSDAIRKAAQQTSCVFVGRCADYILRDFDHVVNIFITASLDFRIANVMKRDNLDQANAKKFIENGESARASFYNYYTGKIWGHATSYDFCIDSSILGITATERIVADFIKKRMEEWYPETDQIQTR